MKSGYVKAVHYYSTDLMPMGQTLIPLLILNNTLQVVHFQWDYFYSKILLSIQIWPGVFQITFADVSEKSEFLLLFTPISSIAELQNSEHNTILPHSLTELLTTFQLESQILYCSPLYYATL